MNKFFRRIFKIKSNKNPSSGHKDGDVAEPDLTPTQPRRKEIGNSAYSGNLEASVYLEKIQNKIQALAERFALGIINRQQFEELFTHYQNEIQTVEQLLVEAPDSDEWKNAISDGQSIFIRRRTTAKLLGFSIYANISGMPLKTCGQFSVDPVLFVPMLHAYQSATKEIFGALQRLTQIENGKWLGYIPGQITTMIAIFSLEPAKKQLRKLEELQKVFERANQTALQQTMVEADRLVCPQEFFITHAL